MIEPRQHLLDIFCGLGAQRRPSQHDDRQADLVRGRDLAVGRGAAAVLRHDDVDAMLHEQRVLGGIVERTAAGEIVASGSASGGLTGSTLRTR